MPHPNDMTYWPEIGCKRGCAEHAVTAASVSLGGPTGYRDLTDIPQRFARDFVIAVWDTDKTPVDGGPYCPARDAVSETILSHGIWEPAETTVMLLCFEATPGGLFIDFGCQLGWFSTLAAMSGMNVIALDADPHCVDLTNHNLVSHVPLLGSVGAHLERLGPDVEPFAVDETIPVPIVVKIDVEGAERYALRKIASLIEARMVDYILIEMSPVFNDSYSGIAERLMDDGFVGYEMPAKRNPPHQLQRLDDLKRWQLTDDDIDNIPNWHQKDVLWARGGI